MCVRLAATVAVHPYRCLQQSTLAAGDRQSLKIAYGVSIGGTRTGQ